MFNWFTRLFGRSPRLHVRGKLEAVKILIQRQKQRLPSQDDQRSIDAEKVKGGLADAVMASHDKKVRRRFLRHRALKKAQIMFQNGYCSMGCRILDESDSGALLRPTDIGLCPARLVLKPLFGECKVVWRKGDMLGVDCVSPSRS